MKKVSFVIPCYRSAKTLPQVVAEIRDVMQTLREKYTYEIILVNDCSPDDTFGTIQSLVQTGEDIAAIDMAKNFGQHAALMAGYHSVTGDIVVSLDDDGQTPPSEVGKLLEKIEAGYDVVYAKYEHKKHSLFRNFGSKVNSLMTEVMLGKPKDLYISSYFAAVRSVIEEVKKYTGPFPYVIGLVLRSTKHICNAVVMHRERESGESGYTLKKLLALWINGFTAFSVKPLHFAAYTGVAFSLIGMVYLIYVVGLYFFVGSAPAGWSTLIAIVLILGGLILLTLGLIGEYIGRIYLCLNHSPQFVVRQVVQNETTEQAQ